MAIDQIKCVVKPLYNRSKLLQQIYHKRNLAKAAQAQVAPFIGDRILLKTTELLISGGYISHFFETGTYLGHTCRYIALRHPTLPITTLENNLDFFKASQTTLGGLANVQQRLGDSAEILEQMLANGEIDTANGVPLFFLDAHWDDYLPLPNEIQSIGRHLSKAIFIIHDFQIPGRDDYGFDAYHGQAIGIPMLKAALVQGNQYGLFLPCYSFQDAFGEQPSEGQRLRGYALMFQGGIDAVSILGRADMQSLYNPYSL
jgi:hypothetical protein